MARIRQPPPEVSVGLVRHLLDVFPRREVQPGTPRDSIMFDAGAAKVIDYLRQLAEKSNNVRLTYVLDSQHAVHAKAGNAPSSTAEPRR
jgi:hypothetical protein